MTTWFDRWQRSPFLLLAVMTTLFSLNISLETEAAGEQSDWGTGYYRLNPSVDRPFAADPQSEENRRRADRNFSRSADKLGAVDRWYDDRGYDDRQRDDRQRSDRPYTDRQRNDYQRDDRRYDDRPVGGRELPRDFYPDTRNRHARPWGEIPPEWRNEDLDRLPSSDERPSNWRRPPRYDDAPYDGSWSTPDGGGAYGEPDNGDYPYPSPRDYRRRDSYIQSPYYEDRSREWRSRRRDPYYYDGGNGWWDSP